ncbi:MAG TPA: alpha/beta hydrolase [Arenimonas sp.]|nr:alpha/beta hydrolase [Arenimonas sp.]
MTPTRPSLRRLLFVSLRLALLVYLSLCALMYLRQDTMLYFPQPLTPGSEATLQWLPDDGDVRVAVSVRERPGRDALLYFGGNAEEVARNLPQFDAAFPDHALYLLHYRGYGASTGEASEAALVRDALALFDQVQARHARVTVVGRSLGSGLAVRVAGARPVARLVLVTPFDSLLNVAAAHYPWLPVRWLLRDRYESWRHAAQVQAPTLIIAAGDDRIIPMASTERLLQRFPHGVASIEILPGHDHNSLSQDPRYLPLWMGLGD